MKEKLSNREKQEIRALVKASAEALHETVVFLRAKQAKRIEAKASRK